MKNYEVLNIKEKPYVSTGGAKVKVPPLTNYCIYDNKNQRILFYIPDYYLDPIGIGNGLIKLLEDNRKIILNLEI